MRIALIGLLAFGSSLLLTSGQAAAASSAETMFVSGTPFFAVGFVATGLVAGVLAAGKMKEGAIALGIVSVILLAMALAGWAIGSGGADCTVDPTAPECKPPPGYNARWNCNWLGTTGTAHDASTEFPDSPFVAADGGTPDYDSTIGTPITNLDLKEVLWEITVDNEALNVPGTGTNGNTWLAEDTWGADAKCVLENPLNAVGGGSQNVPIWGHIKVSRSMGATGNSTTTPVWLCDSTAGWYLGFGKAADAGSVTASHTNDHEYISYTSSTSCGSAPLEGGWFNLGGTGTTTVQNGVYINVWQVLHAGLSSYEDADQTVRVTVELGDDPTDATWAGNVETLFIDMQATHD